MDNLTVTPSLIADTVAEKFAEQGAFIELVEEHTDLAMVCMTDNPLLYQ